jgi:hypothetical protein
MISCQFAWKGLTMFRDDAQACRALGALLATLPALRTFWTSSGPTPQALALLEADGGPLSSGERVLLLAAFALWNGSGRLTFADILARLDGPPLEALCSLVVAMKRRPSDVDAWIAAHAPPLRSV